MSQSTIDNPKTNPAVLENAAAVLPPLVSSDVYFNLDDVDRAVMVNSQ